MSMTKLDPHTAVRVVDLEKGIVAYPTVHSIKPVLAHAGERAVAFRRHQVTDTSARAHENSVEHIFPRLGETGTSAEITVLIDRRET